MPSTPMTRTRKTEERTLRTTFEKTTAGFAGTLDDDELWDGLADGELDPYEESLDELEAELADAAEDWDGEEDFRRDAGFDEEDGAEGPFQEAGGEDLDEGFLDAGFDEDVEEDALDLPDRGREGARGGRPGRMSNQEVGALGESAAAVFLQRRSYRIVERNWRCPAGEADIIAISPEGALVFVEVKARSGVRYGFPSDAVTPARRRRYERIAGYYLSTRAFDDVRVRFDVVSVLVLRSRDRLFLRHHVNAFGVEG